MKNKQVYTPVRFSHLMSYAGIGSIVRGNEDKLMVVVDTSYWRDTSGEITSESICCVKRVSKALNIDKELRLPPEVKEKDDEIEGSPLPAVLFPVYAKCKKCGLLHNNPWKMQGRHLTDDVFCEDCKVVKLEQVTWCAVGNKGYLNEVPWHYICHQKERCKDKRCELDFDATYLKFDKKSDGRPIIKCTKCGCSNEYENKRIDRIYGVQPWLYGKSPDLKEDDIIEILEVNNPGVYMPERLNALVIPPESRIDKTSIVAKLYNNSNVRRELEKLKIPRRRQGKIQEIATLFRCRVSEIIDALEEIQAGYPYFDDDTSFGELRDDEYQAFLSPLVDVSDDEDFVTSHKTNEFKELSTVYLTSKLQALIYMVSNHIVATRLREIQVFKGFYRGYEGQVKKNERLIDIARELVPPDIEGKTTWLPAIELFGEGIFFTIDSDILNKWENIPSVQLRVNDLIERHKSDVVDEKSNIKITPRFLLLHTLSHLLIRELESVAGYPAASLKERIYCVLQKPRDMAGILIYTSVADIVGSLGGIVESGESIKFLEILESAFAHAEWCSLDPVCSEHEGQGPEWLNRAACHACCLIPEPSCEYNNVFLDRVFIKGNKALGIPNFLEFIISQMK